MKELKKYWPLILLLLLLVIGGYWLYKRKRATGGSNEGNGGNGSSTPTFSMDTDNLPEGHFVVTDQSLIDFFTGRGSRTNPGANPGGSPGGGSGTGSGGSPIINVSTQPLPTATITTFAAPGTAWNAPIVNPDDDIKRRFGFYT